MLRSSKLVLLAALLWAMALVAPLWAQGIGPVPPGSGTAADVTVGTTTITGGTTTRVLYDNAGILGEYTATQLTAQINAATATLSGALPAWPNNTTTFFRGDGTYTALNLAAFPTQATNTVLGNATAGTAVPTALAVGTCSTAASALIWTTNTGFGCNTSITATTNANLTGPITSVGNATAIAVQTGTGSTFVVQTSPSLVTPALGVATSTSLAIGGATIGVNALAVTGTVQFNTTLGVGIAANNTSKIDSRSDTSHPYGWGSSSTLLGIMDYSGSAGAETSTVMGGITNIPLNIRQNNLNRFTLDTSGNAKINSAGAVAWASSGDSTGTIDTTLSRNAAGIVQFGTTAANASGGWLAAKGSIVAGTLADQAQAFSITATQPASPTGYQKSVSIAVTSAGSAAQDNSALDVTYGAGYTGSLGNTYAGVFVSNAAGVRSTLIRNSGSNGSLGNMGLEGDASATTTGLNVGVAGVANGGNINAAIVGTAQSVKNSATNIGVVGSAINTGTSPVHIGGFFSLNQTTVPTVSAAAIFDNGAQTDAIILGRNNGSTVWTLANGGAVTSTGVNSVTNTTDSTTTTSGALQVAGGVAIRKRVFIDGITTSSGLQTAVLCQSSGGEMIADSVACLASAAKFKDDRGRLPDGALAQLMTLPISAWAYKSEGQFTSDDWVRERIGPMADDVARMDRRLVGYDENGEVRNYSTEQLLAFTIKALQEATTRIERLEAR